MKNLNYIVLILFVVLISCKGDDNVQQTPSDVALNFELLVDDAPLVFGDTFTNAAGNDFRIRSFWIYLSNIKLIGSEGTLDFVVENSYHLLENGSDIENPRLSINLSAVPAGSYSRIEMAIGVNEPVNTDISAVSGDLDPGRAWNWDSGYKFLSLEGDFLPVGEETRGLIMHIGLNQNYKELSFDLNQNVNINGNSTDLNFGLDINKMFQGLHIIDFNETNTIKANPLESGKVADNYANGANGMIQLQ
jgi:hypothetical protein